MQRIFGIDFTSAPRPRKPIQVAVCQRDKNTLRVAEILSLTSVTAFEQFLDTPGPWMAALDFPFGQPRRLLQAIDWPLDWSGYVERVSQLSADEWANQLDTYRAGQPKGDKHHLRTTDRLLGAQSPMMLYGVPVAKMFRVGAPCLQRADICVLPCRPSASERVAVEAYPAVTARHVLGRKPYKDANRKRGFALRHQREALLNACELGTAVADVSLHATPALREAILEDGTGDRLDAVLCGLQLSAAYRTFGAALMPAEADPVEGWILAP